MRRRQRSGDLDSVLEGFTHRQALATDQLAQRLARYKFHSDKVPALFLVAAFVGIRELKNKLSHSLSHVKQGKKLAITERGKVIAYLTSAEKAPDFEKMVELVREDIAFWKGGKPLGSARPARVSGKPVSEIVIEERR